MAGLAPLGGLLTTNQLDGAPPTVPGSLAPPQQPNQPPQPGLGPNFTAFPSSYAGFGSDGNGFGTLSVVNGALSIVTAPPPQPPQPPAPPPGSDQNAAGALPGSPPQVSGAAAPSQPPPLPPTPPANANASATAGASPNVPNLDQTNTTQNAAANEAATLDKTAATPNPNGPAPSPTNGPEQAPGASGLVGSDPPPPTPTATGLLGNSGPPPIPGGTAIENDPTLGLLGAPATNPIYIQAQQQAQNAAEAQAQADAAAAEQQAVERQQLQQVNFRIAAAQGDNNSAAVAQLQPTAVKLTGQIQNQIWAGLGETPPQPFATPAIPPIFLNIAS